MTIPYYEHHSGIRIPEHETECTCNQYYVVLDKHAVEAVSPDIWIVFDIVQKQCERELVQGLNLLNAMLAISPEGDETYILTFIAQLNNGGFIQ